MVQCPPIPQELIDWLQQVFPDRLPASVPKVEELGRLIGQQEVLKRIRMERIGQQRYEVPSSSEHRPPTPGG